MKRNPGLGPFILDSLIQAGKRESARISKKLADVLEESNHWKKLDTALLQAVPVGLLDLKGDLGKVIGRDFASPVAFDSLLNLTVCT